MRVKSDRKHLQKAVCSIQFSAQEKEPGSQVYQNGVALQAHPNRPFLCTLTTIWCSFLGDFAAGRGVGWATATVVVVGATISVTIVVATVYYDVRVDWSEM